MPRQPTSPSPDDVTRLRNEGYQVETRGGYMLVRNVPYVTASCSIERGTLVAPLTMLDADTIGPPPRHVVFFTGGQPCHRDGKPIKQIEHSTARSEPVPGVVVQRSFSNKPRGGYATYYAMMTRYATIISAPATSLDPDATARMHLPHPNDVEDDSPLVYADTASSRAGISDLSRRLALGKVAIVGLGGTGSYVLDLVAKTLVREIHPYDGDRFATHNAFRAPGAASVAALKERPYKVDYYAGIYGAMHRGIKPHSVYVDSSNVDELAEMDFVFICIDKGKPKQLIAERLDQAGVPFIDVGLGLDLDADRRLGGQVRVTTSTSQDRSTFFQRVSLVDRDDEEELYRENIQVADLNMLNAALAVSKWKKLFGFYRDGEREHHSVYVVDTGDVIQS